jgi:hypothetical protein
MGWGNRVKQGLFTAMFVALFVVTVIQGMGWGGGFPA